MFDLVAAVCKRISCWGCGMVLHAFELMMKVQILKLWVTILVGEKCFMHVRIDLINANYEVCPESEDDSSLNKIFK
jgi:hypothetical protein